MFRKKMFLAVMAKKNRKKMQFLGRALLFAGILWFLSFPYLSRGVFTSENAVRFRSSEPTVGQNGGSYHKYKVIQQDLEPLYTNNSSPGDVMDFLLKRLSSSFETYRQDQYVYSYIRAENGYGKECSIMTFPLEHAASVTYGLTFMEAWAQDRPQWLAKDLIVLFYRDSFDGPKGTMGDLKRVGETYSASVGEFLKNYYIGHERAETKSNIKSLLDEDKVIHGRCGYLRQGYPFVFKDYDFNKFLLHMEGTNGKLSDIDLFDGVKTITSN